MQHWRLHHGKISFKLMNTIKIAEPVHTMNSFYDKDDI